MTRAATIPLVTYCLALLCDEGVVLASDSRTNAGVDYMTTYRKMYVREGPDRAFVIVAAGSLATTQAVMARIDRDLADGLSPSLHTVTDLWEAAELLGQMSGDIQNRYREALERDGVNGEASFIIGGQVGIEPIGVRLVYPQGNAVAATAETPYLQIGETKYGKPMLDRLATTSLGLGDAARLALVSLDATVRSNLTVGLPFEVAILRAGDHRIERQLELDVGDPYLMSLRQEWQASIEQLFGRLPAFDWER